MPRKSSTQKKTTENSSKNQKKIYSKSEWQKMTIEDAEYILRCRTNSIKVYDKIRQLNRQWNKHLVENGKCQNCKYSKHVELAHITPISAYDKKTTIETVNCEANQLVLCPNCHWEFDYGLLTLVDIPIR